MKLEKPTKYKNTHTLAVLLTLSTFLAGRAPVAALAGRCFH